MRRAGKRKELEGSKPVGKTGGQVAAQRKRISTCRRFVHSSVLQWPSASISGVLREFSKFNVQDTSPELQHEFCALWNEIARDPDARIEHQKFQGMSSGQFATHPFPYTKIPTRPQHYSHRPPAIMASICFRCPHIQCATSLAIIPTGLPPQSLLPFSRTMMLRPPLRLPFPYLHHSMPTKPS